MTESIKLIRIDFMMIKNYWKEMLFATVILMVALLPNMPLALNIIVFIAGNTLLSYPFMIQEKDRMDKFYSIIAVSKTDIVRSKYLTVIFYIILFSTLLIPFNVMLYYIMKIDLSVLSSLFLISIGILLYSVVASIQLPCYFKWGYTKSKVIMIVLPMAIGFGVPIIVIGGAKLIGEDELLYLVSTMGGVLQTYSSMIICVVLVLAGVCLGVSYYISNRIYLKAK